jgi:putative FmdB family regulatory protein
MPTYQYSCADCGHFFEQVQSFSEDSLTVCPQCQGRLRKVFNAVGVVFKGSGFYRTDSRADSRGDGQKADGASTDGAKTAGGTEKKSDSAGGSSTSSSGAGGSGTKAPAGTSAA